MKTYSGYEETEKRSIRFYGHKIPIKIHNIPHISKLNAQQKKEVGGEENYNAKQGFYIYRDKRLMIPGDWLGTHAAGVLGNRARVQVDIPSKMDAIYGTDVKKASFQFPPTFKKRLATMGTVAIKESKKDFKELAKKTTPTRHSFLGCKNRTRRGNNSISSEYKTRRS